ncbi:MAG: hypothetical protein JWM91_1079 [Rhodospirillales bacterium]|nr:hypothetical protein [Rhodospirillales bacterium]
MRTGYVGQQLGCALFILLGITMRAQSAPWAEVGDNQLRAEIELLASAGLIDGVTTPWPLPWTSIAHDLTEASLVGQPEYVQAAAARVLGLANAENQPGFSASTTLDITNNPSVVYGFDSLGRGDGQSQASLSYSSSDIAARLSLGGFTQSFDRGGTKLMPDNSYVAAKLGDALVYAGWLTHWWGPGWISALSLSNNTRPMPQIGIERLETSASTWPVLSWLGPWQMEFFLGLLDGPRLQKNTLYDALRITFNPAPGLEIGLARTQETCGQGHPCSPLVDYFHLTNTSTNPSPTNDEGLIDVKYSHDIAGVPAQFYMQLMNEDSSPFTHSGTSHLFGVTAFLPTGANPLRLTVEYTNSIASVNIFSFSHHIYGFSYTDYKYIDGMRYRGRTLGFSLDNDSRLLSLQASWSDNDGRFYELSLHHAGIGTSQSAGANIVSRVPVVLNMGVARVTLPFHGLKLDLEARLQDDQPRPERGFTASFEMALRVAL